LLFRIFFAIPGAFLFWKQPKTNPYNPRRHLQVTYALQTTNNQPNNPMKTNSTSQSALFLPRVGIGLLVRLLAVLIAWTGISHLSYSDELYTTEKTSDSCVTPPAGLVSWWSGDRTAEDVQGTNPGRLVGGASFAKGMVGPAFVFDGIDDGVRIPDSSSLSQIRLTLDAWVYFTGNQNLGRRIVGKDDGFAFREYGVGINAFNNVEGFVTLPSGIVIVRGVAIIQLNTWYHIAMTHDGLKLRLYVDGVEDSELDAVGDTVPTSAPGVIGSEEGGDFTKGIIDEAKSSTVPWATLKSWRFIRQVRTASASQTYSLLRSILLTRSRVTAFKSRHRL
jgi:hypothetical protein